jgi:hypothetical protein
MFWIQFFPEINDNIGGGYAISASHIGYLSVFRIVIVLKTQIKYVTNFSVISGIEGSQ